MGLAGKTALITGGAKGLGKGFAEAILKAGGQVVLADILQDEGQAAAKEFCDNYGFGRAMFVKCDVTKEEDLKQALETTRKCYGYIDIMANNAGISDGEAWRLMIDINMIAVIRGSELAIEYMSTENGGRGGLIINTSSTAGLTGVPFEAVYSATKHAVVGLSRSLALRSDVIDGGIRVCCICPSFTNTDILATGVLSAGQLNKDNQIQGIPIMQVEDVVKCFMKIVEWEDLNGGVVVVTPKGIKIQYPRAYKAKL